MIIIVLSSLPAKPPGLGGIYGRLPEKYTDEPLCFTDLQTVELSRDSQGPPTVA